MLDTGDTAFILLSSALVLIMTPGLAFFYGGMVRRKNVLSTLMNSFFIMGLASLMWVLIGYSLSFGGNIAGIIGTFRYFALNGVGAAPNVEYASTIPQLLFAAFQMMFAIITPALITGSLAERMRFPALFWFIALWSLVVYYPLAHMMWGTGGLLRSLGAVDFAGGNVVHISSGVSGLVACLMLGRRKGAGIAGYRPHNIPFVVLGTAMLWFGWFGFNAGSALGANALAVHAFMTTNTSAACAMLSWMLIERIRRGKPSLLGAATGAVIGLVAITPGAGFVSVGSSIIIGALVSPICYFAITAVKSHFGYDDALDAFGCHGVGGIWGGIATGLFAQRSVNPAARWNGLFFGNARLFLAQLASIGISIAIAAAGTFVCLSVVKLFTPLRVDTREESSGLDSIEHGESAYPSFTGMD